MAKYAGRKPVSRSPGPGIFVMLCKEWWGPRFELIPTGMLFTSARSAQAQTTVAIKDGCDAILTDVAASAPFDSVVALHKPLSITWQFSTDGGTTWKAAGTSTNKMYITLGTPEAPAYEASVAGGCEMGKGLNDWDAYFEAIWTKAIVPQTLTYNGQAIYYYKDWVFPTSLWQEEFHRVKGILTEKTLNVHGLQAQKGNTDCVGCCVIFTELLFKQDKYMAGQNISLKTIEVKQKRTWMMINNWTPPENVQEPWNNTLPNVSWPAFHTGNKYNWAVNGEVVKDAPGLKGQNSDDPASLFQLHVVALYNFKNNTLYDASYGKKHASLIEFEKAAVFGYATLVQDINQPSQLSMRVRNPVPDQDNTGIQFGKDLKRIEQYD